MVAWHQGGWALRRAGVCARAAGRKSRPMSGNRGRTTATVVWSLADVEGRLTEAVDTLKRIPVPDIQRNVTRWPGFVRDACEAYGYGAPRMGLAPAAPDAITRLDETLQWLRWLPAAAQRILWSRANGLAWRRIAAFVGKSPNTCRAWYLAALHHITARLYGGAAASPAGNGARA